MKCFFARLLLNFQAGVVMDEFMGGGLTLQRNCRDFAYMCATSPRYCCFSSSRTISHLRFLRGGRTLAATLLLFLSRLPLHLHLRRLLVQSGSARDGHGEVGIAVLDVRRERGDILLQVGVVLLEVGDFPLQAGVVPLQAGVVRRELGVVPLETGAMLLERLYRDVLAQARLLRVFELETGGGALDRLRKAQ